MATNIKLSQYQTLNDSRNTVAKSKTTMHHRTASLNRTNAANLASTAPTIAASASLKNKRAPSKAFHGSSSLRILRQSHSQQGKIILTIAMAYLSWFALSSSSTVSLLESKPNPDAQGPIHLTVIAPLNSMSPLKVTWREVLEHTALRLTWSSERFILTALDAANPQVSENLASQKSPITLLIGIDDKDTANRIAKTLEESSVSTIASYGCADPIATMSRIAGRPLSKQVEQGFIGKLLQQWFDSADAKKDRETITTVEELIGRSSADDILFSFLVLINESGTTIVPEVANSTKSKNAGNDAAMCMVQNCGSEIFSCFTNTECRTALNCLNNCKFNDQVCSYRCIASHESPELEAFSLCILQKHNCLGLDSIEIPMTPDIAPMTSFRGQPLTHEMAEDMFIGSFKDQQSTLLPDSARANGYSWRVFAGKNEAYDKFPCQFQLFYRGKGSAFWYDPIFKVKTVDNREVWRKRHYRVKRGATPGTFYLSVLDNGVTSKEYWRTLDCADDLEWCVFYYSGAASAAGLSYRGAILVSKDGKWPEKDRDRLYDVLDKAYIKPWELSNVDNSNCDDAVLQPVLALS